MCRGVEVSSAQLILEKTALIEEIDRLQKENETLRIEIELLRQAEADAQKEVRGLSRIVFNRLNGEEESKAESDQITFPYTLKKRVVIFGGHDSWNKAIRPLLRNVRFVSKEASPQADVIRKADVIWIQTNAMAHKDYKIIMDTARTYRIAVKYFTSASAERCAKEVAREEWK